MAKAPLDPKETYIENKVVDYAKKTGWKQRKLSWVGRHGAPDRVFFKSGVLLFVEFKQRGKKPTPNQEKEIGELRSEGMLVFVIDNIDAGKALLDSYRSRNYRPTDDLI